MPEINYEVIIGAFITALPVILINIFQIIKMRSEARKTEKEGSKIEVEATAQMTDVALSLVNPLKDENIRLTERAELAELERDEFKKSLSVKERQYNRLWKGAKQLEEQLTKMDIKPIYTLPPQPENGNGNGNKKL